MHVWESKPIKQQFVNWMPEFYGELYPKNKAYNRQSLRNDYEMSEIINFRINEKEMILEMYFWNVYLRVQFI